MLKNPADIAFNAPTAPGSYVAYRDAIVNGLDRGIAANHYPDNNLQSVVSTSPTQTITWNFNDNAPSEATIGSLATIAEQNNYQDGSTSKYLWTYAGGTLASVSENNTYLFWLLELHLELQRRRVLGLGQPTGQLSRQFIGQPGMDLQRQSHSAIRHPDDDRPQRRHYHQVDKQRRQFSGFDRTDSHERRRLAGQHGHLDLQQRHPELRHAARQQQRRDLDRLCVVQQRRWLAGYLQLDQLRQRVFSKREPTGLQRGRDIW